MTAQRLARLTITVGLGIAGGIHLATAAAHDLTTLHGAFFTITGVVQAVLAVISARTLTRTVALAAGASSATLVAIWFVERLARTGSDNPGLLDTAASLCEALVVVAVIAVAPTRIPRVPTLPRPLVVAMLGLTAALSLAAAPAEHNHRENGHSREEPHTQRSQTRYNDMLLDHHAPAPADPHLTGGAHDH